MDAGRAGEFRVSTIDAGWALQLGTPQGDALRFHAFWLWDNALDAEARDPDSGQRLHTLTELPRDTRIRDASVVDGERVRVVFEPSGRETHYPCEWLHRHAYDRDPVSGRGWVRPAVQTWSGDHDLARFSHAEVVSQPAALHDWLLALDAQGAALTTGGPPRPGAVVDLVTTFGYVRETNYGRIFDVRARAKPENLAYTGLALQAHTDNPYRDPVPTLQLLYCVENDVDGGESVIVDGFRAAQRLEQESPGAFDLLVRHRARFEYAGTSRVWLSARRALIELSPDGELLSVAFNNRSMAPTTDVPYDLMPDFYAACQALAAILDDPDMAVRVRLAPGDCLVVDNTRVLHARTAFGSSGSRWLQGCYADRDGLRSRLRVLGRELAEEGQA